MPELEASFPLSTKMALFHIAGYLSRKDVSENELLTDTAFYFQLYGDYTKTMGRGGLSVPLGCFVQWVLFVTLFLKKKTCRKLLCNIFMMILDIYNLNMLKNMVLYCQTYFLKIIFCLFLLSPIRNLHWRF